MFADLVRPARLADAVEEIVGEDVRLQRAAGFGGGDEKGRLDLDRRVDVVDLLRIGGVQHVEARRAGLLTEGLADHLRAEAGTAHA